MRSQTKPPILKSIFLSFIALIVFYLLCVITGTILFIISSILLMIPIIANLLNYFVEERGDGFAIVIPVFYLTVAYFLTVSLHDRIIKFVPTKKLTMKLLGIYLVVLSSIAFLLNILGDGPWGISIGTIIAGVAFINKSKKYTLPIRVSTIPPLHHENEDETFYHMEAANGMIVRVPESKMDEWLDQQEAIKNGTSSPRLTETEQRLVDSIVQDLYGDPEDE